MSSTYARVPEDGQVIEELVERSAASSGARHLEGLDATQRRMSGTMLAAIATTVAALLTIWVIAPAAPSVRATWTRPLRGSADATAFIYAAAAEDGGADEPTEKPLPSEDIKPCASLWTQCGGANWTGATCCEEESECVDYALEVYPTYRQCRPSGQPPECEDAQEGSQCKNAIDKARSTGRYGKLSPEMDDKEYQMYLNWLNEDESGCLPPCTPGTCFTALHAEGCDTLNTWYCEHDDGSLKFACCCSWFHKEKALEKPKHPDADLANAMKAVGSDSPSLFCTAMCLPHGYELGLLQAQYERGRLGLFGCNEWDVYSNMSLRLTPVGSHPLIKTLVINGSLSAEVGGHWGTALNTKVFIKFWDHVLSNKKAWACEWIVKVDPDTMWLPVRLRALLRTRTGPLAEEEPAGGIFLNNCHVGLHGPIEVLSKAALGNYKNGRHKCEEGTPGTRAQEDWFLRDCFESIGVLKVDAYNMMLEATLACQEAASTLDPERGDRPPCFSPQVAFHPFKATHTWMRCHAEAANHPWALPTVPWTEGPTEANERHE